MAATTTKNTHKSNSKTRKSPKGDTSHIQRVDPTPAPTIDYRKSLLDLVRDLADAPLADPDVDGPDAWRAAWECLETLRDEASTLIDEIDAAVS